jgi:hypothetical protein
MKYRFADFCAVCEGDDARGEADVPGGALASCALPVAIPIPVEIVMAATATSQLRAVLRFEESSIIVPGESDLANNAVPAPQPSS